jgi:hypothetical protein
VLSLGLICHKRRPAWAGPSCLLTYPRLFWHQRVSYPWPWQLAAHLLYSRVDFALERDDRCLAGEATVRQILVLHREYSEYELERECVRFCWFVVVVVVLSGGV